MSISKIMSTYIIIFIILISILSFFTNNRELIGLLFTNSSKSYDDYISTEMANYTDDIEKVFINNGFDITLMYEENFNNFFEDMYVQIQ